MKIIFILLSVMLFSCKSIEETASYDYSPDPKALVRELNLLEPSIGTLTKSFEAYFHRFTPNLTFQFEGDRLRVLGLANEVKIFEYVYLTMFENKPEIWLDISLKSKKSGAEINDKVLIEDSGIKNLHSKDHRALSMTVESKGSLGFLDYLHLNFEIVDKEKNKEKELQFSSLFHNGERESFSYIQTDLCENIATGFQGELQVNWKFKNSHFYKNLTNSIPLGDEKEIAVMPMLGGDSLEESIRESSEENHQPFVSIFRKYLQAFGINLSSSDVLIYNKNTFNILLLSSRKNCKIFREIMSPLCLRQERKIKLKGAVTKGSDKLCLFDLPVVANTYSHFTSAFSKELDSKTEESEDFNLELFYKSDFLSDKHIVRSYFSYDYTDFRNSISGSFNTKDDLTEKTQANIQFKGEYELRLKREGFKIYE